MRILVVEDEAKIQAFYVRLCHRLFGAPVTVVIAETANTAIAEIMLEQPDLVLSDYDLADRSTGADVLAWIREHRPELEPHFVFVSGNVMATYERVRCVPKPFSYADLRGILEAELLADVRASLAA